MYRKDAFYGLQRDECDVLDDQIDAVATVEVDPALLHRLWALTLDAKVAFPKLIRKTRLVGRLKSLGPSER
ncbi:MAG: hypothetical protein A3K19_08135 [Lentisphaerae bacterium RIFOXYB12_FULL_65_16]|nr:MAG: hypothetical protein A3K19_08135 [Lentisphaerae bacterium RIFOXYB12_FULL_65_16]